jgi:putative transposase
MHELAELSAETRDIALLRFRLLEPHLEAASIVAADEAVPFRTAQLFLAVYAK